MEELRRDVRVERERSDSWIQDLTERLRSEKQFYEQRIESLEEELRLVRRELRSGRRDDRSVSGTARGSSVVRVSDGSDESVSDTGHGLVTFDRRCGTSGGRTRKHGNNGHGTSRGHGMSGCGDERCDSSVRGDNSGDSEGSDDGRNIPGAW